MATTSSSTCWSSAVPRKDNSTVYFDVTVFVTEFFDAIGFSPTQSLVVSTICGDNFKNTLYYCVLIK